MSQSRIASFIESWANVIVGGPINYVLNIIVLGAFGFTLSWGRAFWISVVFTVVSIVRSFALRRFFNWINWGNK